MNQQSQGSGSSGKRKRGRPRKEGSSSVQGKRLPAVPDTLPSVPDTLPVMPGSDNVMNSNQTAVSADDRDDEMVGKVVSGVIEGTFDDGYLLNVQIAETHINLRGVVFLPGRVAPITAENDVAPHLRMIRRRDIPMPVPSPQTQVHISVPPSGQSSWTPVEPESQVPTFKDQVLPAELLSGIPVSIDHQSGPGMVPKTDSPKIDTAISTQGIPQGISVSLGNQPGPSILPTANLPIVDTAISTRGIPQVISFSLDNLSGSGMVPKTDSPKIDTAISTQGIPQDISVSLVKQSGPSILQAANLTIVDTAISTGAIPRGILFPFDNQSGSDIVPTSDLPSNETANFTGGIPHGTSDPEHESQSVPEMECDKSRTQEKLMHEVDPTRQVKEPLADGGATSEPIPDETQNLNIDISNTPVSVEPESLPSEQVTKPVDNSVEKQPYSKSADSSEEEQATPKSDLQDTKTEHTTETSSGRSSTHVANTFDLESDPVPEAAPSESKFVSKASDCPEIKHP